MLLWRKEEGPWRRLTMKQKSTESETCTSLGCFPLFCASAAGKPTCNFCSLCVHIRHVSCKERNKMETVIWGLCFSTCLTLRVGEHYWEELSCVPGVSCTMSGLPVLMCTRSTGYQPGLEQSLLELAHTFLKGYPSEDGISTGMLVSAGPQSQNAQTSNTYVTHF